MGGWKKQQSTIQSTERRVNKQADSMLKAVILAPLLILAWARTLQGLPVLQEPLYTTQENFDLAQFLGTWHDVAVATTCQHLQRHGGDAAIGKLVLERGTTEDRLKMTRTSLRHGSCKQISGDYQLTNTPGRFFYHVAKWGADVDAYVVHTNYVEYAIVIMSKQKSSGQKSTSVKLYSRSMAVRATVMDDFKTLVRQQGMSEDTIITKKDKGDCVPGEQVAVTITQPEQQRKRRNAVPSLAALEEEGSGDGTPVFIASEACEAAPDVGPCYGSIQRYYYNSSSMSCELFSFGGCLGNQNNFNSERECLQRCRTEAVCRLPMEPQPCTAQTPIWAFDSSAGLCVNYKPGFCQANGNKFYSKAECEEYCGVVKDDEGLLKAN